MDDTGGMYGAMYALSALYHRNATGQGQHVDQSQWITGVPLNGAAFLDIQANDRSTVREGYPPGNRAHWPGTPLANSYRERTVAPHNAYRTSPEGYNDWCAIVCFTDEEWRRLAGVMGSPDWAADDRFATLGGRLKNQEELDAGIEAWTKTLDKYEIMERCQAAGVPCMPVQSNQDRFENDPQLQQREMFREAHHLALGTWPLQNAPFKMSETPAYNHLTGPLVGQHIKEVFEGLLGISHQELVDGFEDGTFWPKGFDRTSYPYLQEMIEDASPVEWKGLAAGPNPPPAPIRTPDADTAGAFGGLRALELSDEKGQWCGKLLGRPWSGRHQDRAARWGVVADYRAVLQGHTEQGEEPVLLALQHLQAGRHAGPGDGGRPEAVPEIGGGSGRDTGDLPTRLHGVAGAGV